MSNSRRRRLQSCSLTLGSILVVTCLPLTAGAAAKTPTMLSVLTAAKASMLGKSTVHVVVLSKDGSTKSRLVVDIGTKSGMETINSGAKSVTIVVTPTFAYLSGSPLGLTQIMGLTSVQQKKIATHAVSMKAGTTPYTNLKGNLTTTVFASLLPSSKGTVLTTTGKNGSLKYVLTRTSQATQRSLKTTSVMTLTSGHETLPLTETITSSRGHGDTTFSNWGERVNVVVPKESNVVNYKSVFG